MPLPLYRELTAPSSPDSTMHMGLWFERYFSGYQPDFSDIDKEARSSWLKQCQRSESGNSKQLKDKALSMRLLATAMGGSARILLCAGSFSTGLGNPHPLENGFLWHPTLGLPYLPGSAVKGLVRALVETAYEGEDKNAVLLRWFGTVTKGDVAEQSGQFIFMDAFPVKPCELKAEVMTPHMGKWYEKGQKTPLKPDTQPGDWHSPVPVQYLVARKLSLQFVILPRPGADLAELADVWQALETALDWLGAGAKTAIGFGRFARDDVEEKKLAELAEDKSKSLQFFAAKALASPQGQLIIDLEQCIKGLPEGLPAGDIRFNVFWQKMEITITELIANGSADERKQLRVCIERGLQEKSIKVSEKRKKEFKALLNQLAD